MILNEIRRLTIDFQIAVMGSVAHPECLMCVRGNGRVHASGLLLALAALYNQLYCMASLHNFSKMGCFAVSSTHVFHLNISRLVPQEV